MAARVIDVFEITNNVMDASWQEYVLARRHYHVTCKSFDATNEDSIQRFHAARERKERAFDLYMGSMILRH